MEKFRAIKIVHNIYNRIDYLFLAEFFRLCGLYVGEEDNLEQFDPMKELEDKCFDFFIFVSKEEQLEEKQGWEQFEKETGLIFFDSIRSAVLGSSRDQKIREVENKDKKSLLIKCLEHIGKKIPIGKKISESILMDVYVDNDLMICSSSLQYYPKKESLAIQMAGKGMLQAYSQLNNADIISDIKSYQWYAKIWCAVKVNDACKYRQKILYFEPLELAEECEKLSAEYPDFSNAIVLRGLCYEHSKDRAIEAIGAFQQALECEEEEHCYCNAIYYWIGKRYEAYEVRKDLARKYYFRAYQTKRKFRNIYKMAIYEKDSNRYMEAEDLFLQIIDALSEKLEVHMADPLELEYAFKAYQQMCVMFYNQCDDSTIKYRKVIEYGNAAIKIKNEEIGRSALYVDLYDRAPSGTRDGKLSAVKCREISLERINLENIYKILFFAYNDLQEHDLARKCLLEMEKLQKKEKDEES